MEITHSVSVLIPVFNEQKTIARVLMEVTESLLQLKLPANIVVVDDGSSDGTAEAVEEFKATVSGIPILLLKHGQNMGKGSAIQSGLLHVDGEFLLIQDADLEYRPRDYPIVLEPLFEGHADIVYGSRFIGSKPHRVLLIWHYLGNRLLTLFSNIFTNLNLSDMETGMKAFRTSRFKGIVLYEKGFGFEPEVTAKMSKIRGIRFYEVGISYYGRTYSEGKKISWKDGVYAFYCIIRYNIFG